MSKNTASKRMPIAVVGVSALFPGSLNVTGFWKDILEGQDLISDVPESHWLIDDYYDPDPKAPDKTYANRGAFLKEVDFDALGFGVPPTIVPATDTAQLLALIVAQKVLQDAAGEGFKDMDRSRMSVILGVTSAQELLASMVSRLQKPVWLKAMREGGLPESKVEELCQRIADHYVPWQESTFPGLLGNVVAGRIANRLNLGGTNCVTDAACASTFSALSMAVNELYLGDSDVVIAGGVDTMNDIFMYMCFSKTPALSKSGDCRPFSDKADGTMLGEGLGMIALKRLEDAERDGDPIYAVIRGVGASSDGRSKSVYAPVPKGQAQALRRAYERAGYGPETVELVEAHGTGTIAGDAAEFEGLRMVFDESDREDRGWCALGSVKSQIGHTKAAAGAAGLLKAVFALHHKILPPTIKVDAPNPKMDIEKSAFYLNTHERPWVRGPEHNRRASVSSFGFGGSNFHVTMEAYTGSGRRPERKRVLPLELITLSADSAANLAAAAQGLVEGAKDTDFHFLAWQSQRQFNAKAAHRLSIVAAGLDDLKAKIDDALGRLEKGAFETPSGIAYGQGAFDGKVAFLMPGQGSQYVDMGAELAMHYDKSMTVWEQAAALPMGADDTLHGIVFPNPSFAKGAADAHQQKLTATEWAQPAIGCVSLSLLPLLSDLGLKADMVGGHSFGELMALHVAGVVSSNDALRMARKRGELMRDAAKTPGSMTAVSAPIEKVRAAVEGSGLAVKVANHNHPKQVVLSGATDAIEAMEGVLKSQKMRFTRLGVATAFHSPIVAPASDEFGAFLAGLDFQSPQIPVYANATAKPYGQDAADNRRQLAEQIKNPVHFVDMLEGMYADGARLFVEVGPGSVLTGLTERTLKKRSFKALCLDRKGKGGLLSFLKALGQLSALGLSLNFDALWDGYAVPVDPQSVVKPKLSIPVNGSNYGKPYPPKGPLPEPNHEPVIESFSAELSNAAPIKQVARQEETMSDQKTMPQALGAQPVVTQPVTQGAPAQPAMTPQVYGNPWMAQARPSYTWLHAFQEAQRQTAEVHASYQRAMAQSHAAYLRAAEAGFMGMAQMATGGMPMHAEPMGMMPGMMDPFAGMAPQPMMNPGMMAQPMMNPAMMAPQAMPMQPQMAMPMQPQMAMPAPMPAPVAPAPMPAPVAAAPVAPAPVAPVPVAAAPAPAPVAPAPAPAPVAAAPAPVAAAPTNAPAPAAPAPAAAQGGAIDLNGLLLDVVADKTGYPSDMLSMDMELEGDLGIDSIKRVEILSAMQDKAPGLPQVDAGEMAKLSTLGMIVDYMQSKLGGPPGVNGESSLGKSLGVPTASVPHAPKRKLTLKDCPNLGRFALKAIPKARVGLTGTGFWQSGRVAVTDEGTGLSELLVERLKARGLDAQLVREVPKDATAFIYTGALKPVQTVEEAIAINREAFRFARAFAQSEGVKGGAFITVQDTGGQFGLTPCTEAQAYLGGVAGLTKTAFIEWPEAFVRAIDLECAGRSAAELAGILEEELIWGGTDLEVGLDAENRRFVLASERRNVVRGERRLKAGDVVVVSGGARGVTAATVIELAKQSQNRFVLLGRSPIAEEPACVRGVEGDAKLKATLLTDARARGEKVHPRELGWQVKGILAAREIRATLAQIKAVGGEAIYRAVDVTDGPALQKTFEAVRQEWGGIHGVIHGAGVIADKELAQKTDDQFDRVFNTKVDGLRALLAATASDDLKVLCMFSSVAGRCGNRGQSDYAMANEILNKVAGYENRRRGGQCLVKSLGWGPWEGGMVTPQLKAQFDAMGVPLIPLDVGAEMLVDELWGALPDEVELVMGGEPKPESLLKGDAKKHLSLSCLVSKQSHPYLMDHAVDGVPVIPAVMVAEWFARLAKTHRGDLKLKRLRDLRVLKGITLEKFADGGERFELTARQVSNGNGVVLSLLLQDAQGRPRYKATAEMMSDLGRLPNSTSLDAGGKPFEGDSIYGGVLFHGPDFQVIQGIESLGEGGASAHLSGVRESGWEAEPWVTDPALLDGALQMALLWGEKCHGSKSLPTGIGEIRFYEESPMLAEATAVLKGREIKGSKAICDIVLLDNGRPVIQLSGVETHQLPGRPGQA